MTDYIRSEHHDSSEFQEDSFRTITFSEEEGIKTVIGKPKRQNTAEEEHVFCIAKSNV
jgi:hypothetical protein